MAKLIDLNLYTFIGKEKVLLDTNILLYLFGPFNGGNDYGYSSFLNDSLTANAKLYVNNQILSEFINRNCRLAYEQYLKNSQLSRNKFPYKKSYRKTKDFNYNYQLSMEIIETEILAISTIIDIKACDIDRTISEWQMLDFNDELILQGAKRECLNIVTHDTDFSQQNSNIPIMSYHKSGCV